MISDRFKGLDVALDEVFPSAKAMLCLFHIKDNLKLLGKCRREGLDAFHNLACNVGSDDEFIAAVTAFRAIVSDHTFAYFSKSLLPKKAHEMTIFETFLHEMTIFVTFLHKK